jgi:hypothetical protein
MLLHPDYTTDHGKVKLLSPGLGRDDGQRLGLVAEQVEAKQHMTRLGRFRRKGAGERSSASFLAALSVAHWRWWRQWHCLPLRDSLAVALLTVPLAATATACANAESRLMKAGTVSPQDDSFMSPGS